jgi:hypothetical protein
MADRMICIWSSPRTGFEPASAALFGQAAHPVSVRAGRPWRTSEIAS